MRSSARLGVLGAFALMLLAANAGEVVGITSGPDRFDAMFSPPERATRGSGSHERSAAVVLIHSAGGYNDGTTGPLARALNAAGFATAELRLFDRPAARKMTYERMTAASFAALQYLAGRPDIDPQRIGVAGFSMGAYLTIWTASEPLTTSLGAGRKFAAHAAVYPVCWQQTGWAKGESVAKFPALAFSKDFLTRFTGAPVKLFAAGKDDYDDRDPGACVAFIDSIDEKYRGAFELVSYPDATHGWNQASQSFFTETACKGHGCMNRNVFNKDVTEASTKDIVRFFAAKLREERP
jgi:uncharacterized protein